MVAIAHPTPHPRQTEVRPALRLVRNVARPSDAVYRRRRLGAVVLLAGFALAVAVAAFTVAGAGTAPVSVGTGAAPDGLVADPAAYGVTHASPPAGSFYVVQPGDTLWSIARRLQPEGDVRPLVDQLVDLNGGADLAVGQRLPIP